MTPRARLTLLSLVALAASGAAVFTARATWVRVRCPASQIDVPGLGNTSVPRAVIEHTGGDVIPTIPVLALLTLICVALSLLAGSRTRAVLFAAAFALSLWLVASSALGSWALLDSGAGVCGPLGDPNVERTAARALTAVFGAVVVIVTPFAGMIDLPRVRMPESGPADPRA